MLKEYIRRVLERNPEYADVTPVIEKEILHHDIMHVMVQQGAMQSLTFIGGTSLRLCHNSSRLSEDLDFNAGHDFKPANFAGLEVDIKDFLQKKYETEVWVNKPNEDKQGNTSSWKISIEKEANRTDLPRQKMHIDVCAIPSFDIEKRVLLNHYNVIVPTEGLLIPVQTLEETLADKFIALAYRARRIKPRDVWDIVWINQRGIKVSNDLIAQKLDARNKTKDNFVETLRIQVDKLLLEDEVRKDFNMEMARFVPRQIKANTLDNSEYWPYVQSEIKRMSRPILDGNNPSIKFDMGG
jgi:predicted nucleotidyltransferase component of viral defense system